MKFLFLLASLIIIINFSKCQDYCDLLNYCSNCLYCGISSIPCNCNFYNGYCLNENSNQLLYSREFLTNYDGCYSNEGDILQICGESYISIKNGESKYFNLNPTNKSNFFCYYNIVKEYNLNSNLTIKIQRNGNLSPDFNLFLLIYDNNNDIKEYTASNVLITDNYLEINENDCRQISIYLEFTNPQNIEKLSLNFSSIVISNSKEIIFDTETSSSSKKALIGIIIGGVAFIAVILITIILIKRKNKNKKEIIEIPNDQKSKNEEEDKKNEIKTKAKDYLDGLTIAICDKELIKNHPKCNLCHKDIIYNDLIIKTNCSHIFHENCFHNYIMRDFCLKCPNCQNDLHLDSNNVNNRENITISNALTKNIPEQINQDDTIEGMKV